MADPEMQKIEPEAPKVFSQDVLAAGAKIEQEAPKVFSKDILTPGEKIEDAVNRITEETVKKGAELLKAAQAAQQEIISKFIETGKAAGFNLH